MSNWIEEVEKRLYAKPDYKHHAQDRADIRRALRIIKRLRAAVRLDCQDPDVCGMYGFNCDNCKKRKAALEYEGEG